MKDVKYKKLESIIKKVLMEIIINYFDNGYLLNSIVIEEVELSRDYSYIKIYTRFINLKIEEEREYLAYLNKNVFKIRNKLVKEVKLRKIPKMTFVVDNSRKNSEHIDKLLKSIN